MYEYYGDYYILSFDDLELRLLLKVIEHYSSIHHDRLNSCDSEVLFQLYSRFYEKLGGK